MDQQNEIVPWFWFLVVLWREPEKKLETGNLENFPDLKILPFSKFDYVLE